MGLRDVPCAAWEVSLSPEHHKNSTGNGDGASVWGDEKVLEPEGSDHCSTAMNALNANRLHPLKWFKPFNNGKSYMVFIFYTHTKNCKKLVLAPTVLGH